MGGQGKGRESVARGRLGPSGLKEEWGEGSPGRAGIADRSGVGRELTLLKSSQRSEVIGEYAGVDENGLLAGE
jgi:hypothetical protein